MQGGETLVGQQIRKARLRSGLSLDRLAASVGTSRRHLIRLENGEHLPRPGLLAAIARETGQPRSFFLIDEEDGESTPEMYATLLRRIVRDELIASEAMRTATAIIPGRLYDEPSKTRLSMALARYARSEAA